jgi:signal transduction histidine kinase
MTDELSGAIAAVKANEYSFCKFISANDAGTTGAHQAGLYIPKNSQALIFDTPGIKGQNKERFAEITWFDGTTSQCCFKYYGVGTRNEYRVTRLGKSFREDEFIIIVKKRADEYLGFILSEEAAIDLFLKTFEIESDDTNKLIPYFPVEVPALATADNDVVVILDENIPESNASETRNVNFRPKAHILTLLGEELIKDPVMAIYELIKNSYDADAQNVSVYFNNITDKNTASIIIKDSGIGMTEDILENVWLEPGTAFRKPLDADGKRQIIRSPVFNRVPMGEKGVGRFAVHKLGSVIKLISRPCIVKYDPEGKAVKELLDYEINLEIDWQSFTQSKYLSDIPIQYQKNTDPESFYFKNESGTYIKVSGLKETWNRGMARQLKRHTVSMVSPKNDPVKFNIDLNFNNNWLDKFPDINELLLQAPYKLTAILDRNYNLTFEYEFKLANNLAAGTHKIKDDKNYDVNVSGGIRPLLRNYYENKGFDLDNLETILNEKASQPLSFGEIMIELYSYDLDAASLKDVTYTPDILKKTLKDQYGIKVFKGDLRVYDYGEPGNDWLGLDNKRVNNKEWFSNNQNIGFIYLDSETSGSLIEKTNREGFISNESFDYFRMVIEYILTQFRIERQKDRLKWMRSNKRESGSTSFTERVSNFVALINDAEIDDENKKQKLLEEASKIGSDYEKAQETLLIPAGVGMTASVALHEIEKLVPRMEETVDIVPVDQERIRNQVIELDDYVSGILSVLKQAGTKPVNVSESINQALSNYQLKLQVRRITVTVEIPDTDITVKCDKRYLVTVLMNLIDNSMYWLDTTYRERKSILIKVSKSENATSIIIADNGPGFKDSIQELVTPFFSRKEGGIGIGMYLIDTIMMKYGKLKIFTENSEAEVDELYTGAIVELVFNKNQED